jgi:hypothetical protein
MVNWVIIGLVVLVLVIIWIKIDHKAKRIKMILVLLFIVFIYLSVSSVVHRNNIDLSSPGGWYDTGALYLSWLSNIGTGMWNAGGDFKNIIGNVIKTNSTKTENQNWKINVRR